MTCENYQERILSFLDHELLPAEQADLAKHLKDCAVCAREFDEVKQFRQEMHQATIPFRQSSQKIQVEVLKRAREENKIALQTLPVWNRIFSPLPIAITLMLLFVIGYFLLPRREPLIEQLASFGIQHYSLVDQTHPVRGDAQTVRVWFRDHHHMEVVPPAKINYAELSGCKMTELNSEQVPLLRLDGEMTKAIFILPTKYRGVVRHVDELSRDGFRIEFWSENDNAYMALSKL